MPWLLFGFRFCTRGCLCNSLGYDRSPPVAIPLPSLCSDSVGLVRERRSSIANRNGVASLLCGPIDVECHELLTCPSNIWKYETKLWFSVWNKHFRHLTWYNSNAKPTSCVSLEQPYTGPRYRGARQCSGCRPPVTALPGDPMTLKIFITLNWDINSSLVLSVRVFGVYFRIFIYLFIYLFGIRISIEMLFFSLAIENVP